MLTHIYIYTPPCTPHHTQAHHTHTRTPYRINITLTFFSVEISFCKKNNSFGTVELVHTFSCDITCNYNSLYQSVYQLFTFTACVNFFFFQITKYCLPDASEAHLNSADFVGVVKLVIYLHLCTSLWWGEKGLGVRQTYFCIYSQYRDKTKQKQ